MANDRELCRAYSILSVTKAIDDGERRVLHGIATTPTTDRVGDIVESLGAEFNLPLPLLLHHDARQPIGEVFAAKKTKDGIPITARIFKIDEPGTLKDRLDEAWQSIKIGLIKGLSIGFKSLEHADLDERLGPFGPRHFLKWLWLELSAVTIPANGDASILGIKSADAVHLVAFGNGGGKSLPGVSGATVRRGAKPMNATERRQSIEAKRGSLVAEMETIQAGADAEGRSKNESEREKFTNAQKDLDTLDQELADALVLEKAAARVARVVVGESPAAATVSRDPGNGNGSGVPFERTISVHEVKLPPGIGFARSVMCEITARLDGRDALQIAKQRYPDHGALHRFIEHKGSVPAATTTQTTWASPLVYADNLAAEFIEYLRPATILGKFGTNGIPALTRVPFNVRVPRQITDGNAWWVGEGQPKPVTMFGFDSVSLTHDKVAAISVLTKEVIRLSTPSAETLVRNSLSDVIVKRIDIDFIDPNHAATTNVSPASITNGLTAMTSAGTSSDNVITDIANILQAYIEGNHATGGLVLIMPESLAMVVGLMRNSLGQRVFPDINRTGGTLEGLPIITSQYAANQSGGGNLVIAVHAPSILLADDGNVTVDMSDQASLQMLDNPTNSSATATATSVISLWQTNSVGLRAERELTWVKGRSDAVVYMDDVNWGSIGSPS